MASPAGQRQLLLPNGYRKPAQPVLDRTHPINNGLVGAWMLGENANGGATDLTGFSYGTPTSVTQANSHHGGTSYAFNGTTSALALVSNPIWNFKINESISISAWTNLIFGGGGCIIDNVVSTNRNFSLNDGNTDFTFTYGSSGFNQFRTSGSLQQYSAWHHLGVTFTYGGNNIQMYMDGQPVSGTWISGGGSNTPDSASGGNIGGASALNNAFHGSLDCIRLWKRYLSAYEMARLFSEPYVGIYNSNPYYLVGAIAGDLPPGSALLPYITR